MYILEYTNVKCMFELYCGFSLLNNYYILISEKKYNFFVVIFKYYREKRWIESSVFGLIIVFKVFDFVTDPVLNSL